MGLRLGIDSGGTKVLAVLFDDEFHLLGHGSGEGGNANFDRSESIAAALRTCLQACLHAVAGQPLEAVYITALYDTKVIVQEIDQICPVKQVYVLSEGRTCALAGVQSDRCLVALAGTGATMFAVDGARETAAGGWGSWIGDEGSGYYLGRRAIEAAIHEVEGRGPSTLLTPLLLQHFHVARLHEIVPIIYGSASPRKQISAVAKLVSEAAKEGDTIAFGLLEDAGEQLAAQVLALYRRQPGMNGAVILVSGSVWKGASVMFDTFCRSVRKELSHADIQVPLFEPVMGGVILAALQSKTAFSEASACGKEISLTPALDAALLERLSNRFDRFLYRTDWKQEA